MSSGKFDRSDQDSPRDGMSSYRNQSEIGGKSRISKVTMSKTGGILVIGGEIQLNGFQQADQAEYGANPHYNQDDFNREDIEIQQFEGISSKHRFVESIISGKYKPVKKDFDPNKIKPNQSKLVDKDGDGIVSTQELVDFEMKEQQKIWVDRLSSWYNLVLGLLAGMSLMQLIAITSQSDKTLFLASYATIANLLCTMQQIFASLCLVLGGSFVLIYRAKSLDMQRDLHPLRTQFQQQYSMELWTAVFILVAFVSVHIEPKFVNKFFYYAEDEILESDFQMFKILNYMKNFSILISWFISSTYKKASMKDVDLEPEEDVDEDNSQKSDTDADDTRETNIDDE